MSEADAPADPRYAVVERLHLRQWAMRVVIPLSALSTNGRSFVDVPWLPRADSVPLPAPLAAALPFVGAALVAVSAVIRVAAKGVLVRKTTLTTGGIYGYVRHPFYLANLIGAVGTFLIAGPLGLVVAAVWSAVAAPIYAFTVAGEDAGLARLYPEAFARYAAEVRALVPGAPPATHEHAAVTWQNLRSEREPPRLARFVAGALLVAGLAGAGLGSRVLLAVGAALFGASYSLRGER